MHLLCLALSVLASIDVLYAFTCPRDVLPETNHAHHLDASTISSVQETSTSTPAITERMLSLTSNPNVAIIIDMENVRGKTSFELDHADFLDRLKVWASLRNYAVGRTIVVVDHGSRSTAHLLQGSKNDGISSICVTFAGPYRKADDVIARDARWFLSEASMTSTDLVVVVTADQELSWRCRSANPSFGNALVKDGGVKGKRGKSRKTRSQRKKAVQRHLQEMDEGDDDDESEEEDDTIDTSMKTDVAEEDANESTTIPRVEIIPPQRFLEDLEEALREWLRMQEERTSAEATLDTASSRSDPIPINSIPIPSQLGSLQTLFHLRGRMLSLESSLRHRCNLHKRQHLTVELRTCKEEWKDILQTIVVDGESSDDVSSLLSSLATSLSATLTNDDIGEATEASLDNSFSSSAPPSTASLAWEKLSSKEQDSLLTRWGKRRGRPKREKTEDRIAIAERLRRQMELVLDVDVTIPKLGENNARELSLIESYVKYVHSMSKAVDQF